MKLLAVAALCALSCGCASEKPDAPPIERERFVISPQCRTGVHPTKDTDCVPINDHQAKCNEVIVDFACLALNPDYKGKK